MDSAPTTPRGATLSAEKRAVQILGLREDPRFRAALNSEPLAVIGFACRCPGEADDPDGLWRLLLDETDAIGPTPPGRWFREGDAPLGGYLRQVDGIDVGYFGLTEREAAGVDPQQRLFMEVAVEALEDAGRPRATLAGSRTGVFVGACVSDYARRALAPGRAADPFAVSGVADAMIANRLSYILDLAGPSMAVDTACSSSLVALHLACQSLRSGECDLAIAGGVNAILTPEIGRSLAQAGMLAADGRCKTFDDRADGFVRGEGAGAVAVVRFADATAAGDRIHAVIRGSAINQDGRSNGLTAPNPLAQERVIRAALGAAGVAPEEVGYVEAHGTGTALGDPIEIEALNAVYDTEARIEPLVVGSIKANIGHLEGAAGIAGIIKTILCLKHGLIPRQIHFESPNRNFGGLSKLRFPARRLAWGEKRNGGRRFAGVSAFGFGGTNVHMILEEPPPGLARRPSAGMEESDVRLLAVTAADPVSLRARAVQAADSLAAGSDAAALEYTLAFRSSHLPWRLAVTGAEPAMLSRSLRDAAAGFSGLDWAAGRARRLGSGPVFVFGGQGSQWPGMGRRLLGMPSFRAEVERCDAALQAAAGWTVTDVLEGRDQGRDLARTEVAQPVLVALQLALAASLRALGVAPAAVIGHSVGEISAAVVSGALSVDAGMGLAELRGRLLAGLAGRGRMAAVDASVEAAQAAIEGLDADLAAVNAPGSAVLSGSPAAIDAALARLRLPGRFLSGSYAFHGRQTAAAAASLEELLSDLAAGAPSLPMISTVTGAPIRRLDAAYWASNVRERVKFADAVGRTMDDGHDLFLEIGPHPTLLSAMLRCWEARGGEPGELTALATLRRATDDRLSLRRSAAGLFVRGVAVDWSSLGISAKPLAPLPPYPWQRRRAWLAGSEGADPPEPAAPAEPGAAALYEVGFARLPPLEPPRLCRGWEVLGPDSAWRDSLTMALGSVRGARRVLALPSDSTDCEAAVAACDVLLTAVRAADASPLWLVIGDPAENPVAAALWALAEAVGHESPGRIAGVVGVASGFDQPLPVERIAGELELAHGHRVVLDEVERRGPVMRALAPAGETRPAMDPAGAYLVTGGLGGIGLVCAGWLADRGARRLVLAGRNPPTSAAAVALEGLRRRGVQAEVAGLDVADEGAVARLLDSFGAVRPSLCGVVHCAGVLQDSLINGQNREALERIFAPKARGAEILDRLTTGRPLDFMIFMSSMAGLFGAFGQAGYGAANAFLDALARRRRARGEAATSIAWGPWLASGMATRLGPAAAERRRAQGVGGLTDAEALAALDQAVIGSAPVVAALRMDWPRFVRGLPQGHGRLAQSLLADHGDVGQGPQEPAAPALPESRAFLTELRSLPPLAQRGRLRLLLADVLASMMGARPDLNRGFFDQGMDSLMIMEFRSRLNARLGGIVTATAPFEHGNAAALGDHILSLLRVDLDRPSTAERAAASARRSETLSDILEALRVSGDPTSADERRT